MGDFESYGNGVSGRRDGPLFDARHILMPAALVFGTIGEAAQVDVERYQAQHIPLPHMQDWIGKTIETIGSMPLDSKAIGLACGVLAVSQLVQAANTAKDIAVENSIIAAGLSRESAVEQGRADLQFLLRTFVYIKL